jgi:hypothetical protein
MQVTLGGICKIEPGLTVLDLAAPFFAGGDSVDLAAVGDWSVAKEGECVVVGF